MPPNAAPASVETVPAYVSWTVGWAFPADAPQDLSLRWSMVCAFIAAQVGVALLLFTPMYAWGVPDAFPWFLLAFPLHALAFHQARASEVDRSITLTALGLYVPFLALTVGSGGVGSPAMMLLLTVPATPLSVRRSRMAWAWVAIVGATAAVLAAEPGRTWAAGHAMHPAFAPWAPVWFASVSTAVMALGMAQVTDGAMQLADRLRHTVDELEQSTRRAEAANDAKGAFLAQMSHEIRTPMNGVLGSARLLARSPLDDDQRRLVRAMDESASALLVILDDILELSRIEAGHLPVHPVECDLHDVLHRVVLTMIPLAGAKGLDLRADVAACPAWVVADPSRLRQVLTNLVGNAIKYTDDGHVTLRAVRATTPAAAEGRTGLRFEVTDTGPGITPEAQEAIFERFTRGADAAARHVSGTGLGLSITRRIVGALGGRLGVDSQRGVGSTFWFELDLPEVARAPDLPQPQSAALPTGVRALLVEDNRVNRLVCAAMLKSLGCYVQTAENGVEGLRAAEASRFDIVFMDWTMPVMGGREATRALRASRGATPADVPIIALTADVMPATREQALAAGANAFVGKPTTLEALADVTRRHLRLPVGDNAPHHQTHSPPRRRLRLPRALSPENVRDR